MSSSRRLILATEFPKRNFFFAFRPAFVGSFAVAVFAVFGIYLAGLSGGSNAVFASLNREKIKKEIENVDIQIKIEEITYRQEVADTVASALTEITSDRASHLNKGILKNEADRADVNNGSNGEIDELLQRAIF